MWHVEGVVLCVTLAAEGDIAGSRRFGSKTESSCSGGQGQRQRMRGSMRAFVSGLRALGWMAVRGVGRGGGRSSSSSREKGCCLVVVIGRLSAFSSLK